MKIFSRITYGLMVPIFCLLSSCGYHFGKGTVIEKYNTISVPYIEGDLKGKLTRDVIHQIAESGRLKYLTHGGELILTITILDQKHEHIGFRYFRNASGNLEDRLVPSEDRVSVLTQVSVYEAATGNIVLPQTYISASVNTDFDPEIDEDHLLNFSMGQLEFVDTARRIALKPLYRSLASKIVDYIANAW